MVRRLILAATSAGPAMLVKPADILDFFWQEQKRQTAQARRLAQFDTDAAALR
jgi:hypothetical protein